MPDDHLAVETQPGVDKSRFAIAVRSLVQIHKVHVDLAPWQITVELRMQVQEGLVQRAQPANPHLGGREGVHPKNEPRAIRIAACLLTDPPDLLRSCHQGLENQRQRHLLGAP